MASASAAALISSVAELKTFLSSISSSSTIYLDLEGNSLGRRGTISLITALVKPQGLVRLIDVLTLGKLSFTTASDEGKTLKSILENPSIPKCFWDVRSDADALWALYRVDLASVIDIQLLENASRVGNKKYVRGLDKCVQFDLNLKSLNWDRWTRTKREFRSLMPTNVFSVRPVEAKTVQYCTNDVIHLPALHALYMRRIRTTWLAKAKEESARRVQVAHSPQYKAGSSANTLGPWGRAVGRETIQTMHQMDEPLLEDVLGEPVDEPLLEDPLDGGVEDPWAR